MHAIAPESVRFHAICEGELEALRQRDDLGVELGRRDVAPSVAVRDGEQRQLRRRLHSVDQEVGDVGLRIGGDDGRHFELNHGSSFGVG
jgi:hypothetical protein